MAEKLTFETDAAIIDRLGRELVAKHTTALIELIKNAFDADATEVNVVFDGQADNQTLTMTDNGVGMNREELVHGFLRLASDNKVRSPRSKKYKRLRAGRKGIGRFSTQRLARRLILTTCHKKHEKALQLRVDWDQFIAGRDLESIRVDLREAEWPLATTGTILKMEGLRDEWGKRQLQSSWRGVLALQQPFLVAPIENDSSRDPGFSVKIFQSGEQYSDEKEVVDFESEILKFLPVVIELRVDALGQASWRISKNDFGEKRPWKRVHHEHPHSSRPPAYSYLREVNLKAYYVILEPSLLPSLVFSRVRGVLVDQGGIRLYRNGFRVPPYGEPDNDWLDLDEVYAKRSTLIPVANRNFFGIVQVSDPEGSMFEEHTSREGLIETGAFVELQGLASSVLISAATAIGEDRNRKTKAGTTAHTRITVPDFVEVLEAAQSAREAAQLAARERDLVKGTEAATKLIKLADRVAEIVEKKQKEEEERVQQMADESAMLRFLATLGMTMAEFSHETGMTFNAFRLDFQAVFDAATKALKGDQGFMEQARRARSMLDRLDSLTGYLNTLAAARAARGIHPVSLKKTVVEFEKGVREQAANEGIQLTVKVPPYEPLFTAPLHQAELASVLLNFYTNSVKAMRAHSAPKKILISADECKQSGREKVRLRFSDTGVGVPSKIAHRIFDPFFTSRAAPPGSADDLKHASGSGLGLWIVQQIAHNAKGDVRLSDPPSGYSTCFELVLPAEEQ